MVLSLAAFVLFTLCAHASELHNVIVKHVGPAQRVSTYPGFPADFIYYLSAPPEELSFHTALLQHSWQAINSYPNHDKSTCAVSVTPVAGSQFALAADSDSSVVTVQKVVRDVPGKAHYFFVHGRLWYWLMGGGKSVVGTDETLQPEQLTAARMLLAPAFHTAIDSLNSSSSSTTLGRKGLGDMLKRTLHHFTFLLQEDSSPEPDIVNTKYLGADVLVCKFAEDVELRVTAMVMTDGGMSVVATNGREEVSVNI